KWESMSGPSRLVASTCSCNCLTAVLALLLALRYTTISATPMANINSPFNMVSVLGGEQDRKTSNHARCTHQTETLIRHEDCCQQTDSSCRHSEQAQAELGPHIRSEEREECDHSGASEQWLTIGGHEVRG